MENLRVSVPDGCSANVTREGSFLVISFEPKEDEKWEPKDGDICVSDRNTIFIFNGNDGRKTALHFALFNDRKTTYGGALNGNDPTGYRYATEEEKQHLFDALAKEGKRWNAEEKRIEDLPRWRAKKGDLYFCVNEMQGIDCHSESKDGIDNSFYTSGNYFRTKEAAEKVAAKIREIFKNSEAG